MNLYGKLIYLASPFRHDDPDVMDSRYKAVMTAAGAFIGMGHEVYAPIAHNISIRNYCGKELGLGENWEYWCEQDKTMLSRCDEMWVLMLDGWDQSVGVRAEKEFALERDIPVKYVNPYNLEVL